VRYDPTTGKLLQKYAVPGASQVTSCAFGGPTLSKLFITTAAAGVDEAKLDGEEKNAGHLFELDLTADQGITGVSAFSYLYALPLLRVLPVL
jgi:sugar lactone lactonase YvrE